LFLVGPRPFKEVVDVAAAAAAAVTVVVIRRRRLFGVVIG
jgi:hypothetical protein